jgi:hypothetical protein
MGKAAMVTQDIEESARLVNSLDADGATITAAVLTHDISLDLWRLVLAVPRSTTQSKLAFYQQAQKAITELDLSLSLARITRIFDTDPLVGTLKTFAENGLDDVVEVPLGGVDFGGGAVDRGFVLRVDAVRYEEDVASALQRLKPADFVFRRANRLPFADRLDFDFVLDSGVRSVIFEAKYLKHPLRAVDVQQIAAVGDGTIRYYPRASLVIVAKRGFSQGAEEWVSARTDRDMYPPVIILVKWGDRDDDNELSIAIQAALQ